MASPSVAPVRLPQSPSAAPEVSIVMPCLNEAETLETCLIKAHKALSDNGINGEVIVADNGSTDGSLEIASRQGARIVHVGPRGYGSALINGIQSAKGKYIIMADSDDSHNFSHVPRFLQKLEEGFELVVGNRFQGGISPGAMSTMHRYLGTPVLTGIGRLFYGTPIGDINCGMRGFTREAWEKLELRSLGMEFASEMIVRTSLLGLRIAEVPTTMDKDGRTRPPHLRTWRDGWRHLRLLLLYCPRWVFVYPGASLMLAGLFLLMWLLPGPRVIGSTHFDIEAIFYGAMAILAGFQAVFFGVFSRILGITQGVLPKDERLEKTYNYITLEVGLLTGLGCIIVGALMATVPLTHLGAGLIHLGDSPIRVIAPGLVAITLGVEIVFSSFLLSMLGLVHR